MIDFKKLVETAEFHIKRGDNMSMDPKVVRQMAVRLIERDDKVAEEIAGMVRINPHIAISKSGDPIFTSPEHGHDDDEFPECPHCGGTGLEVQKGEGS